MWNVRGGGDAADPAHSGRRYLWHKRLVLVWPLDWSVTMHGSVWLLARWRHDQHHIVDCTPVWLSVVDLRQTWSAMSSPLPNPLLFSYFSKDEVRFCSWLVTFMKTRYLNQIWTRNTLSTEVRGLSGVKEDNNRLENKEVTSYNLDDRIWTCDPKPLSDIHVRAYISS